MAKLPDGTVTMMFSDIDGSTLLLSRLGPTYAEAMDAQRALMRAATTSHDGREMGTEGDSFFVVFPTAPAAVAAASQAQRDLQSYPWPQGERVRVRMGLHTGNPTVHRGGYVGMDVHRAARIANAAHGGQVVLSDSTAHLVTGGGLPDGAQLRDLGVHRLKDLPAPEHLFQLRLPGLESEFAPLRTLGAASSLPVVATPLVGRDDQIQDIVALVGSRRIRLLTLTGQGGAGKTRLAIAAAERLIESFPDGVYFVPLASVTTSDAMWTTIAEVLGVPPRMRTPPTLFDYIGHRSALLVLDNLEQLDDADSVVSDLVTQARQLVVMATSRRPLHVAGEHERQVQLLELPTGDGLAEVSRASSAQLFVQQAGNVRSSFALTDANAAVVAAICRRLDGLPLAIELAAARTKILSPTALLGRLDRVLDMASVESQAPSRQRTLRDTIDWSYRLLTPPLQTLFRSLGVYVGGADLEAIAAILDADEALAAEDPLDLVAGLVDASLVSVLETHDGEPRIGILKTMRAFATDQLPASGEERRVRTQHARYFLGVAAGLSQLRHGPREQEALGRFDLEIDNFREALRWTTEAKPAGEEVDGLGQLGLDLCVALGGLWSAAGSFVEERRWTEAAIATAASQDSAALAEAHTQLARILDMSGELDDAIVHVQASVEMWRRLDGRSGLSRALETLGDLEGQRDDRDAARAHFTEALTLARAVGRDANLLSVLLTFAIFVGEFEGDYQAAYEMEREALEVAIEMDALTALMRCRQNIACSLRLLGRAPEAREQMVKLVRESITLAPPLWLCELAEDYAAVLVELGDHQAAARLFGAAEGGRQRLGTPMYVHQQSELADSLERTKSALSAAEWEAAFEAGRDMKIGEALASVAVDG